MDREVFAEFARILESRKSRIGAAVLEIGAVPTSDSLLNIAALSEASERIGIINLDGGASYKRGEGKLGNDFTIVQGNANEMTCFADDRFDTVLCNAVFEHDRFFWKSLAEIRRVAKNGALIVVGAPGYDQLEEVRVRGWKAKWKRARLQRLSRRFRCTPTVRVHNWPGDYYRFSRQAFREVIMGGMRDVEVYSMLLPPRIIGVGYNQK